MGVSLVTDTDVEGVVITDLDLLDREVWSRPFVTRSATAGETTVFTGVVVGLHAIARLDVIAMLRAVANQGVVMPWVAVTVVAAAVARPSMKRPVRTVPTGSVCDPSKTFLTY